MHIIEKDSFKLVMSCKEVMSVTLANYFGIIANDTTCTQISFLIVGHYAAVYYYYYYYSTTTSVQQISPTPSRGS